MNVKRQRVSSVVLFGVIFCFGSSLYAQKEPVWVQKPQSVYSEAQYLAEVGEGISQNAADVNAIGNLSRIFGMTASSDTRQDRRFQTEKGRMVETSALQASDSVAAAHDLLNTKIADRFYNKKANTYYSVAVMEKKQTLALLQKTINENILLITGYKARLENELDLIVQYSIADMAAIIGAKNDAFAKQIDVLSGGQGMATGTMSQQLRATADGIAQKITFGISTEGDSSAVSSIVQQMLSDLKIKMSPKPSYMFYETISYDFVDTGFGVVIANFVLQLDLKNPQGVTIFTFTHKGKSSGESKDRAKTAARLASAKEIKEPLTVRFMEYLNSVLK